jgi:hypothetical protein
MRILRFIAALFGTVTLGVTLGLSLFWFLNGKPAVTHLFSSAQATSRSQSAQTSPSPAVSSPAPAGSTYTQPDSQLSFWLPSGYVVAEENVASPPTGTRGKRLRLFRQEGDQRLVSSEVTLHILYPVNTSSLTPGSNTPSAGLPAATSGSRGVQTSLSTPTATPNPYATQQFKKAVLGNVQAVTAGQTSLGLNQDSLRLTSGTSASLYRNQYGDQERVYERTVGKIYVLVHLQPSIADQTFPDSALQKILSTLTAQSTDGGGSEPGNGSAAAPPRVTASPSAAASPSPRSTAEDPAPTSSLLSPSTLAE